MAADAKQIGAPAERPARTRATIADARRDLRLSHLPRVEFRQEKRRNVRYLLSIVCAIVGSWLVRLMPDAVRSWLERASGDFTHRHWDAYRENVRDNLRHVVGAATPDAEIGRLAREVFRNNARNFSDLLMTPHLSARKIVESVRLVAGSWDELDVILARGKGAVLITGHLGAFDFVGQALHQRGYKLTTVTGRTTGRFLFDAVTFLRRSHNMELVEATPSGIKRAIQALRRGECAVFVTDRDFFLNGMPACLFGHETTLPPGPVRIARATGAPIVPIFAVRTSTGHGLAVEAPFWIERTKHADADLAAGIAKVADVLERWIGAFPDQWVMFQRVWPSALGDRSPAAPIEAAPEPDLAV